MKEHTSAGLSKIYFGHMKACALSTELLAFEATIGHILHAIGYTPSD